MGDVNQPVRVEMVPLNQIAPDPNQPRKHFDEEALATLADSVRVHGVIQPIIIRPAPLAKDGTMSIVPWWIIGGERRWRAAGRAGLAAIPATIREDLSESDIEVLQVIENLQRSDLTLVETAAGVAKLVAAIGNEKAAQQLGMSEAWVSKHARLLDLPDEVSDLVKDGSITSADIAFDLAKLRELSGGVDSYYINDALRAAGRGQLTRASLRSSIQSVKSIIESRERREREDEARVAAARERIEKADISLVDVRTLSTNELVSLKESATNLPPAMIEKKTDILFRIEQEEAERAKEDEAEEQQERERERERIEKALEGIASEQMPIRLELMRRLYDELELPIPEVDDEANPLAEYGLLADATLYTFDEGVDISAGIIGEVPTSWAVIRGNAQMPASVEASEVTLVLKLPLYRMRQAIDAILAAHNSVSAPVQAVSGSTESESSQEMDISIERADIQKFLSECVDRSDADARLKGDKLFARYRAWCQETETWTLSGNKLAVAIEAEGIVRHRFKTGVHYLGCKLVEEASS